MSKRVIAAAKQAGRNARHRAGIARLAEPLRKPEAEEDEEADSDQLSLGAPAATRSPASRCVPRRDLRCRSGEALIVAAG